MRISIFGNCQAAPLRSLFSHYTNAEAPSCPLIYMVTEKDRDSILSDFSRSDLILTQRVAGDFGVEWVRISSLREVFGSRVIIWPNVYFDGYYPDVRYIYTERHGKVVGPLSDYHFGTVLKAFRSGKTEREATEQFRSKHIFSLFPDPVGRSLGEIRSREKTCDVAISDYIEERFSKSMIQFTPNHPRAEVLIELARRLCVRLGLDHRLDHEVLLDELESVYLPPYPAIAERYNFPFDGGKLRGVELVFKGGGVSLGASRTYEVEEAVAEYYKVYSMFLPERD
jgi:hypothetical protein